MDIAARRPKAVEMLADDQKSFNSTQCYAVKMLD
jgi:hypothetical protein